MSDVDGTVVPLWTLSTAEGSTAVPDSPTKAD